MKKTRRAPRAEFSGVVIDAFKAGDYPQGKFTAKELAEIADSYDPALYEAPITIGHISDYKGQTKIPAFGWIGAVKVVGDHIKLVASQFSEELKAWYKEGLYKKVSAAFYPPSDPSNPTPGKWHLHHLAFLGAQPPQVKGLEGIAFCEMGSGSVEFAEIDASVAEAAASKDTYQAIEESFAMCLAKLQDAIVAEADDDVKSQRMNLALGDCYSEIAAQIDMHFDFMEKVEQITKTEMSEFKTRLREFAASIFNNKRKEAADMDAAKEKEYTDKIAAQAAQLAEFAEAKKKAEDDAAAAAAKAAEDAAKAADDKLRGEIKEFCEKNGLATKKMDDLHLQDALFQVAKVQNVLEFGEVKTTALDIVKGVLAAFKDKSVPEGTTKEFSQQVDDDKRPDVIKDAEKYVKAHAKEFSGKTPEENLSRALYLHASGQIKFEGK